MENNILKNAIQDLQNKLKEEEEYYENRIKVLTQLTASELTEEDKKELVIQKPLVLVNPISLGFGYVADVNYYALSMEDWKRVLDVAFRVRQRIFEKLTSYEEYYNLESYDCDDFALLTNAIIILIAKYLKLNYQLAFGIAWSDTHAFNIFITSDNQIYIYEPQNGSIYSYPTTLEEYYIKEVWFMG
jgi:hypothetical protein